MPDVRGQMIEQARHRAPIAIGIGVGRRFAALNQCLLNRGNQVLTVDEWAIDDAWPTQATGLARADIDGRRPERGRLDQAAAAVADHHTARRGERAREAKVKAA